MLREFPFAIAAHTAGRGMDTVDMIVHNALAP